MRTALYVIGMLVFGLAALAIPAWLFELRESRPLPTLAGPRQALPPGAGGAPRAPLETLAMGLRDSLDVARQELAAGHRTQGVEALDAARLAARAGQHASEGSAFESALHDIEQARKAIENGRPQAARRVLEDALAALNPESSAKLGTPRAPTELGKYDGGTVINAQGIRIGEVVGMQGQQLELVLGGARDVAGIFDLSEGRRVTLPASALLFGPARFTGLTLVVLPTLQTPPDIDVTSLLTLREPPTSPLRF